MKKRLFSLFLIFIVSICMLPCIAEGADPSPAIFVASKNARSVVGIQTSVESWSKGSDVTVTPYTQGSGVVIKDGGYILTNYHVIENGNVFEILLPSGEYMKAKLIGSDPTLDIAVLQTAEETDELVTCEIGSVADLKIGSTAIAIGNPGGDVLANTVTMGIISALERDVDMTSGKRAINYIQHDAAINNGNSGGGLFDYRGLLIGINTLKYVGSAYSTVTFEGLGFALPIDTILPLVEQIIEYGKVIRPQMGVYTYDWDGPDEPMDSYPPASVLVADLVPDGPAQRAGIELYDFIVEFDHQKVANYRELTTLIDKHEAGDTVHVKVLRYKNIEDYLTYVLNESTSVFGRYTAVPKLNGYTEAEYDITLEILE